MAVDTTVQVTLPQMGESVTEGTVLEWHKQEGDSVEADETLVEISTDKVDAEVPAPASGTVVKIHAAEGDTVSVGAVLAEIATGNGAAPTTVDEPAAEAPPEAPADGADGAGELVDIETPAGGESVSEGTILEWAVKVGDAVEDGQTVVEISTDKVDMELPAPAAGTIAEILAEEGETVTVGQVIARLRTGATNGASPPAEAEAEAAPAGNGAPATTVPDDAKVSPVAARIAAAEGVDLSAVSGTGPGGRITKADVLEATNGDAPAEAGAPPEAGPGPQPIRGAAAMLARYMDESRSIPGM